MGFILNKTSTRVEIDGNVAATPYANVIASATISTNATTTLYTVPAGKTFQVNSWALGCFGVINSTLKLNGTSIATITSARSVSGVNGYILTEGQTIQVTTTSASSTLVASVSGVENDA